MKKFVLCLTAVLFAAGTAHAEYVRKRIRPNFFIPARELERAEKLPPFPEPAEEPDNGEEIHYVIPAQTPSPAAGKASAVVVDHETPPEKVHVNFLQTKLMEEEQPAAAPVDSYVTPEPWAMPGYDSDVIMAAGAFIQGSSIELSADGPLKPPYAVYFQGGLTWPHAKLGILMSLQKLYEKGHVTLPVKQQ